MNLKRVVCTSTLAAGVTAAGLFGLGAGTASADPGPGCGGPNAQYCQNGPDRHDENGPDRHDDGRFGNDPVDWQHRGIDQGRQDHQSFLWQGHRVDPLPAGNGDGWGFWFLGQWIRL